MNRLLPTLLSLPALIFSLNAEEPATDLVVHMKRPEADLMLVIPAESNPVRAVLIHGANKRLKPDTRWTELTRSLGYAHLVVKIDMSKNRRPRRLRTNIAGGLNDYATLLERPELANAPLATVGHSAGGMALPALIPFADRFLTTANDCSWVFKRDRLEKAPHMKESPLLFTIRAIPDAFNMIPAIEQDYDPTRAEGAPWSLGFEWGKAHKVGNAVTLFASWFPAVDEVRLSEEGKIISLNQDNAWLGSREDWDSPYPTIASAAEYTGDKTKAVWLPTKAFAYTWRAYQSNSPFALTLTGPKTLKDAGLGKGLQVQGPAGQTWTLGIKGEGNLKRVRFFREDIVLGEVTEAPWTATWTGPVGPHVLHAEWTLEDGTIGVTRPALVICTGRHEQVVQKHDLTSP